MPTKEAVKMNVEVDAADITWPCVPGGPVDHFVIFDDAFPVTTEDNGDGTYTHEWAEIEPMTLPTPVPDDEDGGYLVPEWASENIARLIAIGQQEGAIERDTFRVRFNFIDGAYTAQCTPTRRGLLTSARCELAEAGESLILAARLVAKAIFG